MPIYGFSLDPEKPHAMHHGGSYIPSLSVWQRDSWKARLTLWYPGPRAGSLPSHQQLGSDGSDQTGPGATDGGSEARFQGPRVLFGSAHLPRRWRRWRWRDRCIKQSITTAAASQLVCGTPCSACIQRIGISTSTWRGMALDSFRDYIS